MTYKISGVGFDVPLVSLVDLAPQPRSIGPQTTRRSYSASGKVFQELGHIELIWDLIRNLAAYDAILAQFGLGISLFTNEVTAYIPDQVYGWQRVNGIAVRPQIGEDVIRERFFVRRLVILIKNLTPAS
jgi:hypothetical protein